MKKVSLSGSSRENVGTKDATAVRNAGKVPCVVYGGDKQIHFSAEMLAVEKIVFTPHVSIVELDVDGKKVDAIIQAIQFHPVTDKVQHIDFLELKSDKKVKIEVPVKLTGRSVGVMAGGKLQQVFRKLKVHALPGDLPDSINIDITELKVGDSVRVKDVTNDKVKILNTPNSVIVSVKSARGVQAEGAEGAPAAAKPAAK